jgi:uncharacterized protein YjbI with pentapeptide repeats
MTSEEEKRADLLDEFPWLGGTPHSEPAQIIGHDLEGGRFDVDPGRDYWFEQITLCGVDFGGAQFGKPDGEGGLTVSACLLEDCNFSDSTFHSADLGWGERTVYRRCAFDRASLRQILGRSPLMMAFTLGRARFEDCTFLDATIRGWLAHEAEFVRCRFRGTIDRCRFFGTWEERRWLGLRRPRRNEYRGNDFREVEFIWSSFEKGIPIGEQLWPEGPEYVRLNGVGERIRRARPLVATWPERDRQEAEVLLTILSEQASGGQDEIFDRRVEPDEKPARAAVHERIWKLLEDL